MSIPCPNCSDPRLDVSPPDALHHCLHCGHTWDEWERMRVSRDNAREVLAATIRENNDAVASLGETPGKCSLPNTVQRVLCRLDALARERDAAVAETQSLGASCRVAEREADRLRSAARSLLKYWPGSRCDIEGCVAIATKYHTENNWTFRCCDTHAEGGGWIEFSSAAPLRSLLALIGGGAE